MKNLLVGLLASLSVTLGNLLGHRSLPVPQIAIQPPTQISSGQVLGAQDKLTSLGVSVGKLANTLVQNVTSTPSSQTDVIDMSNVVHDISSRVESIPSTLINQAKIEYCKQVLATATVSGQKK